MTLRYKSVKDYKKMEIAMVKANVVKDREVIITIFFNSLNREIINIIELHHYIAKENMVYTAFR